MSATAIPTATREAWLAERAKRLTASDAAAVLGLSPWRSRLDVWLEKRGEGQPVEETERMRLGRLLEPAILRRYALDCEGTVAPNETLYYSDAHPWLAATPDAIVRHGARAIGLAQAKATSSTSSWPEGQPPLYYQVQAAVEMAVMDMPWDDFPTLIAGADYVCPRVERHEGAEQRILDELHEFWTQYVEQGATPPPAGEGDLRTWAKLVPPQEKKVVSLPSHALPLYERWTERKAAAAAAEREAKEALATLMALQGDAQVGVLPGLGLAIKRTQVTVGEKVVPGYTYETQRVAKWKS